jgi:ubiquinone/menaquinone biosynthesis C-methylase UbiE
MLHNVGKEWVVTENTPTLSEESFPGILIRITDPELQIYLQNYPFASGPDIETNRRCRQAIIANLEIRPCGGPASLTIMQGDQKTLTQEETFRIQTLMEKAGLNYQEKQKLLREYVWKMAVIPRDAKNVLVIGCGIGDELLFIHTVLPDATITAVDFEEKLRPTIKNLINVNFIRRNVNDLCNDILPSFDLIFSNHVLEHMYNPDAILRFFAQVSNSLVATLPMDGAQDAVFAKWVLKVIRQKPRLHPTDFIMIDAGHPWKTNQNDLKNTLSNAGYTDIQFYLRSDHIAREFEGGEDSFKIKKLIGSCLNTMIFGTMRNILKILFPTTLPKIFLKIFFGLENRLWFGSNRLKNMFTPEVLIVANK